MYFFYIPWTRRWMPLEAKLFKNDVLFVFSCFMPSNQFSVWSSFFLSRRAFLRVCFPASCCRFWYSLHTGEQSGTRTCSWYQRLEAICTTREALFEHKLTSQHYYIHLSQVVVHLGVLMCSVYDSWGEEGGGGKGGAEMEMIGMMGFGRTISLCHDYVLFFVPRPTSWWCWWRPVQ